MNKFRKILIGLMVAAGATCLGGAAACNNNGGDAPNYYQLDLEGFGVDIVFQGELAEPDASGESFRFGGKVKEGVDVRFTVLVGNQAQGTPTVSLNSETMVAEDGVYSFTMERDSKISITGLSALYTLSFPKSEEITSSDGQIYREERRIKFYDEDDNEITDDVRVVGGSDYTFKLWVSPYYNDDFTVSCGFDVLEKQDVDGFYSTYTLSSVGSNGEINVTGLTQQTSFANYGDGEYGDGTAENPYKLSKPIDLFYLASIINTDYYSGYFSNLHYELTADIDMGGEQIYVIGDNSTSYSAFCGTFNGNGHTIKNFYITDEVYDQESYAREYLTYVGLFGYSVGTIDGNTQLVSAEIKNVTLEDYTVEVHPATAQAGTYVGSVLGYGIGTEISGCKTVNGRISVINDNNQIVNAGGIVGRLQGAYGTTAAGTVSRAAFVRSCSADVSVQGTGSPHSEGGIVGYLISADESAIAYVVNCHSSGAVTGGMRAGGIVGTMGRFTSVANSYSTARVSAENNIEGLIYEEFRGAYAGGIAGYAEENTVLSGCYAANGNLRANSTHGASYSATGAFVASYALPDAAAADYYQLITFNNQENVSSPSESTFTALGWNESEWDFSGSLPTLKIMQVGGDDPLDTLRSFTVKTVNGSTTVKTATVSGYTAMADWYVKANGVPEYAESASGRSWGYYFDAELTKKVPYGFVPVQAETQLYFGYADYSTVAGTYYIEKTTYSDGAQITLTADGVAQIRSGGLYYECNYSYNGKTGDNIVIYRSCLAALSYGEDEINGGYFAYGGTVGGGVLELKAYLTIVDITSESEYISYIYPTETLRAVKLYDGFVYGEYKNTNGVFYVFNKNGSGERKLGTSSEAFTFAPANGGNYTITFGGGRTEAVTLTGNGTVDTINNVAVSKIDGFKGSWKKFANSTMVFTFDGEGSVSLGGGTAVNYTAVSGGVGFTIDGVQYKATLNNGNLVINGENYYVSDSFTGEWYTLAEKEQISISLGGVSTQGYGNAVISYTGNLSQTVEAEYDLFETDGNTLLRIYVGDRQYGELSYTASSNKVSGSFYSMLYSEYRSYEFDIYDIFRGVWAGVSDGFDTVTFNGRSASAGGAKVTVKTAGNVSKNGTYALTSGTAGTMTVGGSTYNIEFNEKLNKITFTEAAEGGAADNLARRDGWYGVVLYDGDTSYVFDGKSNLTGKVSVSDGTELSYTLTNGAATMGGKALTPTASGFTWDGKTLVFKTGFAGEWYVSATDAAMVITEVDGNMTANVAGQTYVYDPAAKTLTHTEGRNVTTLRLKSNGVEMNITRTVNGVSSNSNGIKSDRADSWRGTYTAVDGSSWKFDGLGSSVFGDGAATYTPANGAAVKYSYVINERGIPFITANRNFIFTAAESGDGDVFVKDGNSYKTVAVDSYYGSIAMIAGDPDTYFFDGNSTVWVKSSDEALYTRKAYNYEVITSNLCEIIDNDGVRHKGRVVEEGRINRFTITPLDSYSTEDGVTYAFSWTTVWQVEGATYTLAYKFVATDVENKYELTDGEGNKYDAVVSGSAITITAVEETTEQA